MNEFLHEEMDLDTLQKTEMMEIVILEMGEMQTATLKLDGHAKEDLHQEQTLVHTALP